MTSQELGEAVAAKADATWLRLRKLYPALSPIRPAVKYNKRLKTTAGRAFVERNPQEIDLSTDLLWQHTDEMINQVLPHEYAHLVAYTIFKDSGHGTAWKLIMQQLGLEPLRCHSMVNKFHNKR